MSDDAKQPVAADQASPAPAAQAGGDEQRPSASSSIFSPSPEVASRELAAGKTPREKAYYIFLGVLAAAAVVLAVWYLDPFGGGRGER